MKYANDFEAVNNRRKGLEKAPKCPICHKSRGKNDLSHGKCVEELAKQEHERTVKRTIKGKECKFSQEQISKGQFNAVSKKLKAGKLPEWMFS